MRGLRGLKIAGAAAILTLGTVLLLGAEEKPAPPSGPTAAQQFKNIKALTNLPASQLLPTMQEYNKALGQQCSFCHGGTDFSNEDKPNYAITRSMILLTQRLNGTEPTVKKRVTCFMCHMGRPIPAARAEDLKVKPDAKKAPATAPKS